MIKNLTIIILFFSLCANFALAGDISKRSYSRNYEWESTDCYKPSAPIIFEIDEFSKWEIDNYKQEVEAHIRCIRNEAQTDYSNATKNIASAIEEGRDQAIEEVISDVDIFVSGL